MGSTGRDGSERATQATASASASRSTMIRIPCRLHPACAALRGGPHAYSHGAVTFPRGRQEPPADPSSLLVAMTTKPGEGSWLVSGDDGGVPRRTQAIRPG